MRAGGDAFVVVGLGPAQNMLNFYLKKCFSASIE